MRVASLAQGLGLALLVVGACRTGYRFVPVPSTGAATCELPALAAGVDSSDVVSALARLAPECTPYRECLTGCLARRGGARIGGGCYHLCGTEGELGLLLVDGVPFATRREDNAAPGEQPRPDFREQDILSITRIPPDSALLARYGHAARYGALVVTTKRKRH